MSPSLSDDAREGISLTEAAATGTTVPNDAGQQNLIPSVPRPDQIADEADPNYLGSDSLEGAAGNPGDIPRSNRDTAPNTAVTGTGDSLPAEIGAKRLHAAPGGGPSDPLSKGHPRYDKHTRQKRADVELGASEGPGVEAAPGEEGNDEQGLMDKVERKEDL